MYYHNRKRSIWPYIIVSVLFFTVGWRLTAMGFLGVSTADNEQSCSTEILLPDFEDEEIDLSLFWAVYSEIKSIYVDTSKIDTEKMQYGAISGMVEALDDPYTVFMDPQTSEEFSQSLSGQLEGIGAELTVEEESLTVVSPLRDSPAEKAGLLPGDIIYKVDGELTHDMSLLEAISKIRGEKGTSVNLTIIRDGLGEAIDLHIIRDSVNIDSVSYEVLDSGVYYASINQFNDKTTEQFSELVSEIALDDEAKGLIIDLRYNGGGYLEVAVDMLSYILPNHSEAVKIKERNKNDDIMYTRGSPLIEDIPVVVLVNEGSASASEIVAGAIMAHKRGIVMGTQTFGKGTVQEVESFKDGSSMRITIAKWFTPDDINIDDTGLTPDIIVELLDEDYENEFDRQKDEAIKYLEEL